VLIALCAVAPLMLVIPPMMVAIVIAFAGLNDATWGEQDQSQQQQPLGR
jgi:hypothetical protein